MGSPKVQDHPWPQSKFEASLGKMRPVFKIINLAKKVLYFIMIQVLEA